MAGHTHTCACGESIPCWAPIVANDGIPDRLCILVLEDGEPQCERCEADSGFCADCRLQDTQEDASVVWDVPYQPYKLPLCDRHASLRQESAPGYGGEPDYDASTLDERHAAADRLNREGRH